MKINSNLFRILLTSYIFVLSFLFFIYEYSRHTGTKIQYFLMDSLAIQNLPFYYGIVTNLGIILWSFTAAVCLFSARLVTEKNMRLFLDASGIMTMVLLFDDYFLFHEQIAPQFLNLSGHNVLVIYIVLFIIYLFSFRKMLLKSSSGIFFVAAVFFGLSRVVDYVTDHITKLPVYLLMEEGFKLMGIVAWFIFYIHMCYISIKENGPGPFGVR